MSHEVTPLNLTWVIFAQSKCPTLARLATVAVLARQGAHDDPNTRSGNHLWNRLSIC